MRTDLQNMIDEKNAELMGLIKETMRVNRLTCLPVDERILVVEQAEISPEMLVDAYYSAVEYVIEVLIQNEGKREAWNRRKEIVMKQVEKKEKYIKGLEKKGKMLGKKLKKDKC